MHWRLAAWLLVLLSFTTAAACEGPLAEPPAGQLCGLNVEREGWQVSAWLGVPYARPPVAELRFADPQPVAGWNGVRSATSVGNTCPQAADPFRVEDARLPAPMSEDCLYLNVWAPAAPTGESLPVLVYLHGGAFTHGSATDSPLGDDWYLQDGSFLAARHNIVVVSLNYRLGVLGFLAQAGATELTGNYGFSDQLLALDWLQRNLPAFGGDPERVTLAGESAGALSVALHLLSSPRSQPLFRSAIIQSAPLGIPFPTAEDAALAADAFMVATGCLLRTDQLGCLRELEVEQVLEAQENWRLSALFLQSGLSAVLPWGPVIDGELLVQQPLTAGLLLGNPKPLLVGYTADEGLLFVSWAVTEPLSPLLYEPALELVYGGADSRAIHAAYPPGPDDAREALSSSIGDALFVCPALALAAAAEPGTAFVYSFTHAPGFRLDNRILQCSGRSCHATELSFVFGTGGFEGGFTGPEAGLSHEMGSQWAAFVSDGAAGMGPWPAWSAGPDQLMEFSIPSRLSTPSGHNCDLWRQ